MYLDWKKSGFYKDEKEITHGLHTFLKGGYDIAGLKSAKGASWMSDIYHSVILCQYRW